MAHPDVSPTEPSPPPLAVLQQALRALADRNWAEIRALCAESIAWRVPGRSPLAGEVVGPDAVVERFQRMLQATVGDQAADLITLLAGPDHAAVVQRNHVVDLDDRPRPFTAVTLVKVHGGRITELEYVVSDQYLVDELWTARL